MSDCEKRRSLFINEKCSVVLQPEALAADLCGLYPFPRAANYAPDQASIARLLCQY